MKVLLILVDGMRADAFVQAKGAAELIAAGASSMTATTVMPSLTLPCHISLFHSVGPERHGTTTNTYAPQVRPIAGLCEAIRRSKKRNALFYGWEELRDVARPGNAGYSLLIRGAIYGYDRVIRELTDAAIAHIQKDAPDFTFLHLGYPDMVGHGKGWMSAEYMASVDACVAEMHRIIAQLPEDYTVIITADHGGHDRTHGTAMPEDMTIPMVAIGKNFTPGSSLGDANIIDIAPTVAALLDVEAEEEWEGKLLYDTNRE